MSFPYRYIIFMWVLFFFYFKTLNQVLNQCIGFYLKQELTNIQTNKHILETMVSANVSVINMSNEYKLNFLKITMKQFF